MGTLAASLLAACSPARVLGLVQPAARGGEQTDIPYAAGPRHAMDIYIPAAGPTPAPLVVFFYGGGWRSGSRSSYAFVGRALAACGMMVAIPDYRVWPEAGFPDFLKDASAAVTVAREEARRRGANPAKLFLMGHSAGAYIAAMLALDPEWLDRTSRSALAGMVGLAGPYDFLPLRDPVLEQIFAPVGPRTQPITFAANAVAPMLLLSGNDDSTVFPANSLRLAARVRGNGGRAETIFYPGIGHVGVLAALASPLHALAPVRDDVCGFLRQPAGRSAAGVSG